MLTPVLAGRASAQDAIEPTPNRLRDRGTGVLTSMSGTYVRHRELLVYPFFEYYRDEDFEYTPSELGAAGAGDLRGRYHGREGLIFLAYGITADLAVEFEAAVISARLQKSPLDGSTLPEDQPRIRPDVEGN